MKKSDSDRLYNYLKIYRTRFAQIIILTAIFLFILPVSSSAQKDNYIYSNASLAEKVYLQLDGKVYTSDNIVWFKAIVTSAIDHVPTTLSGVLHVELIGPNELIAEKKLVKIENGIGDGFFQLHQTYEEGLYMIRAYTDWNKNFGTDFIFREYIRVYAPSTKEKANPIGNLTLVEQQNNERRLNATFDPFAIDSLHENELKVFLSFDHQKDSLTIKKNRDKQYFLDYAVPDGCQFATLKIQTENNFSYSSTIVIDKDYLDLQFFPESGELVHGIQSLVGFKALDCNGKGKILEGEIVDGQDELITTFKSNPLGMGAFTLSDVDSTARYFARVISQAEENLQILYPLPKVVRKGNVLSVKKSEKGIQITASSNYQGNDSISVSASYRGMVYYYIKRCLKDGDLRFYFPLDKLPEGIIVFTMIDKLSKPVAERLYFNERPESRIKITVSADKESYVQRELTKLNIATTNNEGDPVAANLSVLVLNKEQLGQVQDTRQNILSYFLLSSDLKGNIENPGFYFNKDSSRYEDVDALLLTQGWRKYNNTKPLGTIPYQPETSLYVSGKVSGLLFQKKKKKKITITMMTFGPNPSVQTQAVDSLGRFSFNVDDKYGQNVNVLIQSSNKYGDKKEYTIALDKEESPAVLFNHIKSIEGADSIAHALVEKNIERKIYEDAFPLSKGNIFLEEVVVEGYRITPARKKVMDKYGKPDEVIKGEDILEKEEKWSYGLYSVLSANFPDKITIIRTPKYAIRKSLEAIFKGAFGTFSGEQYAGLNNGLLTLVVIDGIPVMADVYPLIAHISTSEVSSFEIIENAKNFQDQASKVFPNNADPPRQGNIIAIYTHAGNGLYGASRTKGLLKAVVPVFSPPREFYAPKHENLRPEDWFKKDLRALVHWESKLMVDSMGIATTSFYNADITGEMQVVIEAISEDGEIAYHEIEYEIEGKEKEIILVK